MQSWKFFCLVFPHIEGDTLGSMLTVHLERHPTCAKLVNGLVNLLKFYCATSSLVPRVAGCLHFWHRDLHPDQIMFSHPEKNCMLLDFGNAHIEFHPESSTRYEISGSKSSTPQTEEVFKLCTYFEQAISQLESTENVVRQIATFRQKYSGHELTFAGHDIENLLKVHNTSTN